MTETAGEVDGGKKTARMMRGKNESERRRAGDTEERKGAADKGSLR